VTAVLEFRRVSKTRGAGRHAVRALSDVSLSIATGEFVVLEGPSGSGKTTVLLIAAGLLSAEVGEVELAGRSLVPMDAPSRGRWRRERLGFVFQRPSLLPALPVRENVMLAALLNGCSSAEARRRSDELLQDLGISALAERRPHDLSGGEEQRVAVARALVHRPAAVLADEPTANLDWASGQVVAERLRNLARERGTAVLVATHDPRLAVYADRRIALEDGRVRTTASEGLR
jgi:putative ABC transport system ATP-binding protein